ncbi:MAG: recombination protein RecR [Elusimicrobia bacterium]|nr:recombination protein RecR [Elusimicrobiota bacterium]
MTSFNRLIAALRRLPGVGPKQAERLALHLLRVSREEVEEFAAALKEAKRLVKPCTQCWNFTEQGLCSICQDPGRDRTILCVVEEPPDVQAIERSRSYQGLYHILHGSLSPLDGIGPDAIRIRELLSRLRNGDKAVREVVLATDPDTEGEATALYLAQVLKPLGLRVTRIAQGVPLGGDLDYTDELTLSHALNGRREV